MVFFTTRSALLVFSSSSFLSVSGIAFWARSIVFRFCFPKRNFRFGWDCTVYCRSVASRVGVDMRTLDQALWQYSKEKQIWIFLSYIINFDGRFPTSSACYVQIRRLSWIFGRYTPKVFLQPQKFSPMSSTHMSVVSMPARTAMGYVRWCEDQCGRVAAERNM